MLRFILVIVAVVFGSSAQNEGVLSVARGHGTVGGSEEFIRLGGPEGEDGFADHPILDSLTPSSCLRVVEDSFPTSAPHHVAEGSWDRPEVDVPAGTKGFSLLKFGPVCMYTK
ncbi:hypothetical protein FOZ60_012188 [Perkinsus olseni]|uniref:Secreted protein n=1 Tax=Perkinsus olseni TaxID=32597 RepID=A0A7J6PAN4_PEROL|nr:hypothetical protein FOZ60_012188 [Perkinsus olseni]